MCSNKLRDFDDWPDLSQLREEVEAQKARVERLKSEQKWVKSTYSVTELRGQGRVDRSDSGIDRQSLLMINSGTNIDHLEYSTSSIKKIIEITTLIRAIEDMLSNNQNCTDTESEKTYSSTCSMPRCFHEVPEQDFTTSSYVNNQLVASSMELEKLNKQLNHCQTQIFKIENVQMGALFNGMTMEQLKNRIDEYYKLKTCLAELATSANYNSTALISVVRQLEPIAQSVEQYFRLSQEVKGLHSQVGGIVQRKNELQNKRSQLMKILQSSGNPKPRIECLPQSTSWNERSPINKNPFINRTFQTQPIQLPKRSFSDNQNLRRNENRQSENEIDEMLKNIPWPPFNGSGISEESPPDYEEAIINLERYSKGHSRLLCHEYVNDDVIKGFENRTYEQIAQLLVASFPYDSITIVQIKSFKLHCSLKLNQQYRARLMQQNGEGSDWNPICVCEDGTQVFVSPYIMLPVKWKSNTINSITLLLELQMFDKGVGTPTNCFMFNIIPLQSPQKVAVPLHTVKSWTSYPCSRPETQPSTSESRRTGSLKLPLRTTHYTEVCSTPEPSRMHLLTNPTLNRSSPPVRYSSIRRSQTFSHDHEYCGNFECCSSIDFVAEPVTQVNQQASSQAANESHRFTGTQLFNEPQIFNEPQSITGPQTYTGPQLLRGHNVVVQSLQQADSLNSNSQFQRESFLRQPIRQKRNTSDQEINSDQRSQTSENASNELMIQQLWAMVCDLYLALNNCSSHDERVLEYAYFKTRCPAELMKLYNYFVEVIFDPNP